MPRNACNSVPPLKCSDSIRIRIPGRSGRFTWIAVLVAVVAVIGYTVFGWRFSDGASNPIAFGIALVAVGIAAIATLRERV